LTKAGLYYTYNEPEVSVIGTTVNNASKTALREGINTGFIG